MTVVKRTRTMPADLIAPCGMNCRLCWGHIRERNRCPGCRALGGAAGSKSEYRTRCRIKNCDYIANGTLKYCSGRCGRYPCARLKQLDKRYRTRYGMSMLGNLVMIHEQGIRKFMQAEKTRWICPECGEVLCVHKPACLFCGHQWGTNALTECPVKPVTSEVIQVSKGDL